MSAEGIASMTSEPIPGHWNTVSVMMAKAMMEPSWNPVIGDDRNQGVLQGVAEVDGAPAQPAGPGELDVVGPQDLQHLGADQPHDERHLEQRQRDAGEDEGPPPARSEQPGGPPAEPHDVAAPVGRSASRPCTEKTRMSRMPVRNEGMDTPTRETAWMAWLDQASRCSPV